MATSWSSSGETPATHTQSVIQTLTKDGDDAQALISVVYRQTFVVVTMLSTGLILALMLGWKFTLAGLGIAPIFVLVMALQSRFSSVVMALGDGYDTVFGTNGGQAQRVQIARAFAGSSWQ
jgi:ABC-type multidrug transport system fused ATPase/permease subunit